MYHSIGALTDQQLRQFNDAMIGCALLSDRRLVRDRLVAIFKALTPGERVQLQRHLIARHAGDTDCVEVVNRAVEAVTDPGTATEGPTGPLAQAMPFLILGGAGVLLWWISK